MLLVGGGVGMEQQGFGRGAESCGAGPRGEGTLGSRSCDAAGRLTCLSAWRQRELLRHVAGQLTCPPCWRVSGHWTGRRPVGRGGGEIPV